MSGIFIAFAIAGFRKLHTAFAAYESAAQS
jgi:hypothetical protein